MNILSWIFGKKKIPKTDSRAINRFAVKVAELEGGKKSANIAEIKEILKIVNYLVDGELYKIIKK